MSRETRDKTVGFIGLGAMGDPMARNLLKKGHALVACDIDPRKNEQFAALGATIGKGPADVARQAHVLISMVDTTAQSEQVIVGKGGFIDAAEAGDVVVTMSSIDPITVQKMHATLAAKGIGLLDAPVSGFITGAERGTLNAYVGGEAAALEKARPALESMTAAITHIGGPGQGIIMKLVNNMLAQAGRILVVEAMVMGTKAGIDPQLLIDLISKSSGNSAVFQHAAPRLCRGIFPASGWTSR